MSKFFKKLSLIIAGLVLLTGVAHATSVLQYYGGGTGTSSQINGIVKSNGTVFSSAVSGTDIKTINSVSLLGSGDFSLQPMLNLVAGTYSDGKGCSYVSSGTLLNCNNTYLTSVGTGVSNQLTYWSGTNTLGALDTATYPSLTELSYVKGLSSAVQTQLNGTALLAGRSGGQILNGGVAQTETLSLKGNAATSTGTNIAGGEMNYYATPGTGTGVSGHHFFTGTTLGTGSTLQTSSEKMTILGSGNVGIGTTNPGTKLEVTGISTFDGLNASWNVPSIILKNSGVSTSYWSQDVALSGNSHFSLGFKAFTASSYGLLLEDTGNVGIGTTSPTNLLSLGGTSAQTIWMERNTTANTAGQGLTISSGGAIAGTADLAGGDLTLKSGTSTGLGTSALHFFTATAGVTGTADNAPTEKVTILGSGNVGIGTTSPGYLLQVAGVGYFGLGSQTGQPSQLLVGNVGNQAADRGVSIDLRSPSGSGTDRATARISSASSLASGSGGYLTLSTENTSGVMTEGMRILNNGNVGIGTTSPTARLMLAAGTATASTAPLKFTSGVVNTTAETGAIEYNGTNLSFVPTGTLRENIFTGARGNITLTAGTTTTVTVAQAKTTSTIMLTPTSLGATSLSAYVSTKSNGSFVITTLTASGTETMDYLLTN